MNHVILKRQYIIKYTYLFIRYVLYIIICNHSERNEFVHMYYSVFFSYV